MKKTKNVIAGILTIFTISASCAAMSFAATPRATVNLNFSHGHDNYYNTAYAATTASQASNIGAKINLNFDNGNVWSGPVVSNYSTNVKAESPRQHFKKGSSFGYYYYNGAQIHQSSAPMAFDWGW